VDNDRIDEGETLLYTLGGGTSAQSDVPSGYPIVGDHEARLIVRQPVGG